MLSYLGARYIVGELFKLPSFFPPFLFACLLFDLCVISLYIAGRKETNKINWKSLERLAEEKLWCLVKIRVVINKLAISSGSSLPLWIMTAEANGARLASDWRSRCILGKSGRQVLYFTYCPELWLCYITIFKNYVFLLFLLIQYLNF